MSDETSAPAAAPTAPQTTEPQRPPTRADHVARAKALLASRRAEAPADTPAAPPTEAPAAPASTPSAAASVLGGEPFTPPKTEQPPLDANDPRVVANLTHILSMEQDVRRQLDAISQRERELASKGERLTAWEQAEKAKAEGNLVAVLETLGIDYEALTAQVVLGKGAQLQPATEELRKLQDEIEAVRREAAEREQKAAEAAAAARVEAYKANVKNQLAADPKRWELLMSPIGNEGRDPVDLIEQTMERHFLATGGRIDEASGQLVGGERLTPEQAADMLEAEIERRTREAATVGGEKLRRILSLTAAVPPTSSAPPVTAPAPTHPATAPTTTTELATRGGPPDPNRVMTSSDYRAAARARARQELKR